jgi:hypothetical protein
VTGLLRVLFFRRGSHVCCPCQLGEEVGTYNDKSKENKNKTTTKVQDEKLAPVAPSTVIRLRFGTKQIQQKEHTKKKGETKIKLTMK